MSSEDLEEYILRSQRKTLQVKIRRTKQAISKKGAKTLVQAYYFNNEKILLKFLIWIEKK